VWRSGWDLSAARNGLGSVLPFNLVYAAGVVSLSAILDTWLAQYAMSTMINLLAVYSSVVYAAIWPKTYFGHNHISQGQVWRIWIRV